MTALFSQTLVSTNCVSCGRPLTDPVSAELGIGPDCRAQLGYVLISSLEAALRDRAHFIIHAIASDKLRGAELRDALFALYELGFVELSKRIERRVSRMTIDVVEVPRAVAIVPAPPPQPPPFTPTDQQAQAIDMIGKLPEDYAVAVVVGYAGTGKTSLIRLIEHYFGTPVVICPTGKAALRVREATGLKAMTIHRWIYKPVEDERTGAIVFVPKDWDDIEATLTHTRTVVLDEASMVGPDVWKDVREVCDAHHIRLILIGDGFQLPPVQAPNAPPFSVLTQQFAQELGAPRIELTQVLRQAQGSPIIRASMALRNGAGWSALKELQQIKYEQIGPVALAVHQQGGVTICHRNATRFQLNAGFRISLGITDEMPQPGEPLLVTKNTYEAGVVNGEQIQFPGWATAPVQPERIYDRYKQIEEMARFGGVLLEGKTSATIAVEELHGRLTASPRAIAIAANRWAKLEYFFAGDRVAPHISANFGYVYTCHKSQGSQWPYVLVILEPSVRLDEDEGRRWTYTAITRASYACAVYAGRI